MTRCSIWPAAAGLPLLGGLLAGGLVTGWAARAIVGSASAAAPARNVRRGMDAGGAMWEAPWPDAVCDAPEITMARCCRTSRMRNGDIGGGFCCGFGSMRQRATQDGGNGGGDGIGAGAPVRNRCGIGPDERLRRVGHARRRFVWGRATWGIRCRFRGQRTNVQREIGAECRGNGIQIAFYRMDPLESPSCGCRIIGKIRCGTCEIEVNSALHAKFAGLIREGMKPQFGAESLLANFTGEL